MGTTPHPGPTGCSEDRPVGVRDATTQAALWEAARWGGKAPVSEGRS